MDRRGFLIAAPTALACGTALGTRSAEGAFGGHSEALAQRVALVERQAYAVAVFPSVSWGACARGMRFENGCLARMESDLIIREGWFDISANEPPEIAIAVANPHDARSWREAQSQCCVAKQAGALTLLFAAHPSPEYRYPFDARMLGYDAEQDCAGGADLVIDFVSAYLLEEFPWIAQALLNFGQFQGRADVPGIRAALWRGRRAIYFWSEAKRHASAYEVTRFARNQLMRLGVEGHNFAGLLALLEGNWIYADEYQEIHASFQNALPEHTSVCVECAGILQDEWQIIHTIASYDAA